MASEPTQRLTVQEYLAFERQSEMKHDYLEGEIFAMTGASRSHNRITLNIAFALETQLEDRDCEVFANEMRVLTPTRLYTYPDIVVACDPLRFDDSELDTLLNPVLVVEVLSKSTEAYDRVTKLSHYRTIPSLAGVILVAQNKVHVEQLIRQTETEWLFRESDQLDMSLELPSLGCRLDLLKVYRKVFK
jgi:Uma2 family endonuclease